MPQLPAPAVPQLPPVDPIGAPVEAELVPARRPRDGGGVDAGDAWACIARSVAT